MGQKEDVIADLLGKSTVKRRKAAKAARVNGFSVCDVLIEALKVEDGSKHWETKVELISALGLLPCQEAVEVIEPYVFASPEHDAVAMDAARALVRIKRSGLSDSKVVWEILRNAKYSAKEGALEAVGYDKMVFDKDDCKSLIEFCWDFGKDRPRGLGDPRYGLAAACAGWDKEVCRDFLNYCLESNDVPLCYVAKKSLQGKYVRLR